MAGALGCFPLDAFQTAVTALSITKKGRFRLYIVLAGSVYSIYGKDACAGKAVSFVALALSKGRLLLLAPTDLWCL